MEKVYIPFEVFQKLPKEESDKLQEILMHIYFKNNPGALRDIMDRADGDPDLIEKYKEEEFGRIMTREYAYDINILRKRKNDELATKIVEKIDEYNSKSSSDLSS